MKMTGVVIETDEKGNILSEAKVLIDDGAATILCTEGRYVYKWDAIR